MKTFANLRHASSVASKLIFAGMISLCGPGGHAQSLFSESFDYMAGTGLAGAVNPGNSTAWTGGNNAELQIGNTQLTYNQLQEAAGKDLVYTSSGSGSTSYNTYSAVSSGSIYYSFLIDCTMAPSANEYISALNPGTSTPGGSSDALSTYVGTPASGFWKIGVRTTGGNSGGVYNSGNLSLNTTYFVVEELTLGSAPVANLYVNPVPGGSQPGTPSATQTGTTAVSSVDDIGFKVQSVTTTGDFDIGNLLIGTTWASVTPETAVPEPSTLALLGGSLVAVWRFRRQPRR